MQSNWRSPPQPEQKCSEETEPITGNTGKWQGAERVADGSVVAMKPGNSGGAKGPY